MQGLLKLFVIQLILAELEKRRNIDGCGFPDNLPVHRAIAVRDKVSHTLDRSPLHTVVGRFSILFGQTAAKFTDLQNTERNGTLIICIPIKNLERVSIALNRLLNLEAIVPDVADPLLIRRLHTIPPFPALRFL